MIFKRHSSYCVSEVNYRNTKIEKDKPNEKTISTIVIIKIFNNNKFLHIYNGYYLELTYKRERKH